MDKNILEKLNDMTDEDLFEALQNANDYGLTEALGTPEKFLASDCSKSLKEALLDYKDIKNALKKAFPESYCDVDLNNQSKLCDHVVCVNFDEKGDVVKEIFIHYENLHHELNILLETTVYSEKMVKNYFSFWHVFNNYMDHVYKDYTTDQKLDDNGISFYEDENLKHFVSWDEIITLIVSNKLPVFSFNTSLTLF